MAEFNPQLKVTSDGCVPTIPCEPPSAQSPCEGDISGTISGKLIYECCCDRLYTRTFIQKLGPQTEPQLINTLQNTVNAWEASGYLVLAHSITDLGSEWLLGLSVGWMAP